LYRLEELELYDNLIEAIEHLDRLENLRYCEGKSQEELIGRDVNKKRNSYN
jgi:hypothetical protein